MKHKRVVEEYVRTKLKGPCNLGVRGRKQLNEAQSIRWSHMQAEDELMQWAIL